MNSITPIFGNKILDLSSLESVFPAQNNEVDFLQLIEHGVENVNRSVAKADQMMESFVLGQTDVQDVMLAVEEANMTMQLAVTVRDKAVEGLQELLRMQV